MLLWPLVQASPDPTQVVPELSSTLALCRSDSFHHLFGSSLARVSGVPRTGGCPRPSSGPLVRSFGPVLWSGPLAVSRSSPGGHVPDSGAAVIQVTDLVGDCSHRNVGYLVESDSLSAVWRVQPFEESVAVARRRPASGRHGNAVSRPSSVSGWMRPERMLVWLVCSNM